MREHLQTTGYIQTTSSPTHALDSRSSLEDDDDSSYSATFRELFCVTAQEIARSLDTSLQNLGCLYEDVLTTGTLLNRILYTSSQNRKEILATEIATTDKDIEANINPILFGKGQLLVLTRRVDNSEGKRLQNLGYRFANMDQVGDQLARSMQVSREDLENLVGRLHSFSQREPAIPSQGTYLASFLIQPSPAVRGLEIVVKRAHPDRLPMVRLSAEELSHREVQLLGALNGMSLDEIVTRISERTITGSDDDVFLENLRDRILDLTRECPESTLHRSIFSGRQLDIVHGMAGQQEASPATVFAFCGIKEIYNQSLQSPTLRTIPLSFFQSYLRSYPGCSDHAILAQKNHKEFSSLMLGPSATREPAAPKPSKWPGRLRAKSKSSISEMSWQPDSSSEKGLVAVATSPHDNVSHPWNIMVTSTQNMTVDESNKDGGSLELRDLGVKSEIGMAETEKPTLADRLMSITTGFRDPHAARALPKDLYYGRR